MGIVAMLLGVAVAVLIMLPFRPAGSGGDRGWETLGWAVLTFVLAAACALAAGAVGVGVGLHRRRCPRPVVTGLAFVPIALVLGVFTQGLALPLAPAAAVWLVDGLARSASSRRPGSTEMLPQNDVAPAPPWRGVLGSGLIQRLVAVVVLSSLLAGWLLRHLGHRLGGELHGSWYVWLACLPVLIVVPTVLLWRRTPWQAVLGLVVVLAAVAALAVPGAVAAAHPTTAKLSHDVNSLGVPDGYRVMSSTNARVSGAHARYGYELPVVALMVAPTDLAASAPPIPEALQPAADGTLPDQRSRSADAATQPPLPSTSVGQTAASTVRNWLLAAGWEEDLSASGDPTSTYWLPRPASTLLNASTSYRLTDGPWVRANVVPMADAAMLVISTRP